jgi:hypothetical protein
MGVKLILTSTVRLYQTQNDVNLNYYTEEKHIDSVFLSNLQHTLNYNPKFKSLAVMLNGLVIGEDEYSINEKQITFQSENNFETGDELSFRYSYVSG